MGYTGMVVLEISTRRALSPQERYADLAESLAFARAASAGRERGRLAGPAAPDERARVALCLQNERDRAVVDQRDRHVGAEHAGLDAGAERAQRVGEGGHQRLGDLAGRRRLPGRPPALGGLRVQRELADHQQRRPGVGARLLAVQDPQVVDLAGKRSRGLLGVVVRHADQDDQARGGQLADDLPGYRYARLTGTLDDSSHEKAFSADDR